MKNQFGKTYGSNLGAPESVPPGRKVTQKIAGSRPYLGIKVWVLWNWRGHLRMSGHNGTACAVSCDCWGILKVKKSGQKGTLRVSFPEFGGAHFHPQSINGKLCYQINERFEKDRWVGSKFCLNISFRTERVADRTISKITRRGKGHSFHGSVKPLE